MTDKQTVIAGLLEIANKIEHDQDLTWTDRRVLVLVLNSAYRQLQQRVDTIRERRAAKQRANTTPPTTPTNPNDPPW